MIGDSHVRRITEVPNYRQYFSLRDATIEFKHQGGAGVKFLWDIPEERYDIIVFCLGSNNLDSGMQPAELFKRLMFHADRYRTLKLCDYVVIMGLWPRANRAFNAKMTVFNQFSTRKPGIFFWKWSKSLNVIVKPDRVHLVAHSYRRVIKYLCSPILYVMRHIDK